ncbi:MAG: rod shape-determining protein [Candidatus Dormibacteraeota bacterium]|nr:rod shape-determining protein [Candidatus Dormibacteraeota bacterium]
MAGRRFAVELAPDRVSVWVRGEGLIVDEPALGRWSESQGRLLASGEAARRDAEGTELVEPMGIFELRHPEAAAQLLRQLSSRAVGRISFARHELVLAVSAQLSTSARRVLLQAALESGARMAHVLDLPLALAFGAGLPVTSWDPSPVLYLLPQGAQAAVVCHHGLLAHAAVEVPLTPGAPAEGAAEAVIAIFEGVIEETPRSHRQRITGQMVHLAGRGVDLEGWRDLLVRRTGMRARVVPDPAHSAVKGAEVALERVEGSGSRALLYLR